MTPQEFIAKWQRANLKERAAAQEHFLDLCALLGQPTPAAADPEGAWYTFERGVSKIGGGKGWADVWMRERFAWEYMGKHKDLGAAYEQLLRYREDLDNPPLLVVCDLDCFEIHTNFTNTAKHVYAFDLAGLAEPADLDILRKVFTDPGALRPQLTTKEITEEIAAKFALLADGMRGRGIPAERAAHSLMKLKFCMFAEDIGLLPEKLFSKVLSSAGGKPALLARRLKGLFEAMATGGEFGADAILYFDGGLFADADVLELTPEEIEEVIHANDCDWSNVEPSIFGTLFERTLDPDKRSQIGAHYTSKEDILTLLEPVLMVPLRREWDQVRAECDRLWLKVQQAAKAEDKRRTRGFRQSFEKVLRDFGHRLETITVLDAACGSGNFLYVAINLLLDLEKQVVSYAAQHDFSWFPLVRPSQLAGIEINPYAQQLAQVVIWIGYLQWMHHNGFKTPSDPVLEPIENIRLMDAILDLSDPEHPKEPEWPEVEFIVGNPPFLGGKLLRTSLGDPYVDALFRLWGDRVRPEADLCCYWFEKARAMIEVGKTRWTGLLATQSIRGGANRESLARIKQTGDIFFAVSDRDWILDGANVHISMVAFGNGTEAGRTLDGQQVSKINANLTATADISQAKRLPANLNLSFMGDTKGGPFDIPSEEAWKLLLAPNVSGKPSSDVVLPWCNGLDVTRRNRDMWIIDFGIGKPKREAALYDSVFQFLKAHAEKARSESRSKIKDWWLHERPRGDMREGLEGLDRYIVTATVAKYRLFVWMTSPALPDHQLIAISRPDDYFLGVLHSRPHEVWARAQGTQVRERESGFRYTPTTCFETFPFPDARDDHKAAIAAAAKELEMLRTNWLNPPEWTRQDLLEFPGSVSGPWARYVSDQDGRGIGTVRYPRTVPKDEPCAKQLAKRTLTNLYNERPTWLDLAHKKLDAAAFTAYGWNPQMSDDELIAALLALNLDRAPQPTP